ncbi:UNKNOWN [Stylonychia lemnae]|uniref:Uncharacterized protein n=1 Tax=Stylonychia lemnae TaxID=5949 RepID=A0A078BER9_STYLE|nr:UNKNOWN [Stylonychia lemnae]|eukprot:CDW91657.1 UNKNOWN [Stylonychia lemnae]
MNAYNQQNFTHTPHQQNPNKRPYSEYGRLAKLFPQVNAQQYNSPTQQKNQDILTTPIQVQYAKNKKNSDGSWYSGDNLQQLSTNVKTSSDNKQYETQIIHSNVQPFRVTQNQASNPNQTLLRINQNHFVSDDVQNHYYRMKKSRDELQILVSQLAQDWVKNVNYINELTEDQDELKLLYENLPEDNYLSLIQRVTSLEDSMKRFELDKKFIAIESSQIQPDYLLKSPYMQRKQNQSVQCLISDNVKTFKDAFIQLSPKRSRRSQSQPSRRSFSEHLDLNDKMLDYIQPLLSQDCDVKDELMSLRPVNHDPINPGMNEYSQGYLEDARMESFKLEEMQQQEQRQQMLFNLMMSNDSTVQKQKRRKINYQKNQVSTQADEMIELKMDIKPYKVQDFLLGDTKQKQDKQRPDKKKRGRSQIGLESKIQQTFQRIGYE